MPQESRFRNARLVVATTMCLLLACLVAGARPARAQAVAGGYARVKASLVKVWALDAKGAPLSTGTGIVVASDDAGSTILTATHAIARADRVIVDASRALNSVPATIVGAGGIDLTLLHIARRLPSANLAAEAPSEGDEVAVAGFRTRDRNIGGGGQAPQLLYPGIVAGMQRDGALIRLDNVAIEAGMSGAPVFVPSTGDVVGIVDTKNADGTGGYAIATAPVVVALLETYRIEAGDVLAMPEPTPAPRIAGRDEYDVRGAWTTHGNGAAMLLHVRVDLHPREQIVAASSAFRVAFSSSASSVREAYGSALATPDYARISYRGPFSTTVFAPLVDPAEDLGLRGVALDATVHASRVVTFVVPADVDVAATAASLQWLQR